MYNSSFSIDPDEVQALIQAIESDEDKFRACTTIRDDLLVQYRHLGLLCAYLHKILDTEFPQRGNKRYNWLYASKADADSWRLFLNIGKTYATTNKRCLASLVKISGCWGTEKVQHHDWGSRSQQYCSMLGRAASQNPVWEDACEKLNQLLLSRIADRRPLRVCKNPINVNDLQHLIAWSDSKDYTKRGRKVSVIAKRSIVEADLPAGHMFDMHGLIVRAGTNKESRVTAARSRSCPSLQSKAQGRHDSDAKAGALMTTKAARSKTLWLHPMTTLAPGYSSLLAVAFGVVASLLVALLCYSLAYIGSLQVTAVPL